MPIDARERLDHYLVRLGWARSRRAAREMLAGGLVRVNGRVLRKGEMVGGGDTVEIGETSALPALEPDPEVTIEVLFRDPAMLVVNKPAPMACHPLRPGEHGTVMNGVAAAFPESITAGDNPREGGLVHRLDNGTSGALLVALAPPAFAALREAIRAGRIRRDYQALVAGNLKQSLQIDKPLAHDPRNPRRMIAVAPNAAGARAAATAVEPIRRFGDFTLVAVRPRTGMRHQIRVHLAEAGHPIAGDALYGGPALDALAEGRFWLHLAEIEFRSPASGPVRVCSPLPRELEGALKEASRRA
ncbi:MAG TPA: RluA family pseudouridine synthase [Candidatus Binataceae bacterium]|nr:RluA family pseudouridine synthase [Candidatus Binataceae bacterium]